MNCDFVWLIIIANFLAFWHLTCELSPQIHSLLSVKILCVSICAPLDLSLANTINPYYLVTVTSCFSPKRHYQPWITYTSYFRYISLKPVRISISHFPRIYYHPSHCLDIPSSTTEPMASITITNETTTEWLLVTFGAIYGDWSTEPGNVPASTDNSPGSVTFKLDAAVDSE